MRLKGLDSIVERNSMKGLAWAMAVLAVTVSGCAVSAKRPPSTGVAGDSANGGVVQTSADSAAAASDELAEVSADEDFELLEEQITEQMVEVADPLEPVNRVMYGLNDILYFWLLKPCAVVFRDVVPHPARVGIRNFFHNVTAPARFVNCLLQGKGEGAGREFSRFVVNSTEGVLGFGDPARDRLGLEPAEEDLGQTLGVYGLGNGFYIVWPLLGPSTLRDSAGMAGDQFLNPVRYVEPAEASIAASAVKGTNENSFHIGEYEAFKAGALEPYVAMREAYIQYRDQKIKE